MGRLIEFYVPDNFERATRPASSVDAPQVIEFPCSQPEAFRLVTSIFPEIDSDLA